MPRTAYLFGNLLRVGLTGWLQPFAKYQPITPMVDAVRSVLVGSTSDLALALVWSALLIVIFTPVAVLRYRHT
jgi:ABC-type polysaccharide/polyol phosphate export permease